MKGRRIRSALALSVAGCLVLAGCSPSAAPSAETADGAAVTASGTSATKDIQYGSRDGRPLLLDTCLADTEGPAPVVVLIHGGGFDAGSRDDSDVRAVCEASAAAGFSTFSVDYTLLPGAVFPEQLEDVSSAIQWILQPDQVERFDISSSEPALLGLSAGAIIAAQLATGVPGSPIEPDDLAGTVAVSGGYRFDVLAAGQPEDDLLRIARAYVGCDEGVSCSALHDESPYYRAAPGLPPVMLVHSRSEFIPMSQAEEFERALLEAGNSTRLVLVDGDAHAAAILMGDPDAAFQVAQFLSGLFATDGDGE